MSLDMPGDLLIYLALIFNLLAGFLFLLVARGKEQYEHLAHKAYHFFVAIISLAVAYLFYLFFSESFLVGYVYSYSDSSLPFFYTLSAFWGGQEGTYLLWIFMNAIFGYIIIKLVGQYRNYAMVIYSVVNLFFLTLLIKLSPFALLDFYPADGAGLNPLLQDPWMVIHPPIIFIGYSMAAIPFSIAMAALILDDYTGWVKRVFPWVAITALMLAAGNILGGYWAYKTLGWGGFWAWDPVENSSFIPWFASLGLLHGLILEKRTGALRKINLLLTAFVFNLVIYGTFLTRSGVLADFSVHSFVDLGINQYLVFFMVLYLVMTAILFSYRAKGIGNHPINYNIYHKEFIIFGGMVLLFLFTTVVLFWTSLPITTGIFASEPRAADLSTYNNFAQPMAIIFALLLTIAPLATYKEFEVKNWLKKLLIIGGISAAIGFGGLFFIIGTDLITAFVFTLVATGLTFYGMKPDLRKSLYIAGAGFIVTIVIALLSDVTEYAHLLFFGVAAMAVISNLMAIIKSIPGQWKTAGAQMTHFGFGLMIIGVLSSAAFTTNENLVLPRGQSGEAYGMTVSYLGMEHNIEFHKNKLLITYEKDGKVSNANPELYYSERLQGVMRKPYVESSFLYDLYFSPVQIQDLNNSDGIILEKDIPIKLGDYTLTFIDFDMEQSHGTDQDAQVSAVIELSGPNDTIPLFPAILFTKTNKQFIPAYFGENDKYELSLTELFVENNAVSISIPGLAEAGPPDRLILDISKKPIISLVWIGTTLIMLGSIIVFIRRRDELNF